MDEKWRKFSCPICISGYVYNYAHDEPDECDSCAWGVIYIRPKGHTFAWPGGPATGMWSEKEYESAIPVMPFQWHEWLETEEEIEKFTLDRFSSLDKSNIVHCSCGFVGTIKMYDLHEEDAKQEFIRTHKT